MLNDQQGTQIMAPIFSDFLDEPGMPKIINMFLDEIPKRIAALELFFNEDNKDEFCKMIHQLKGAGGGYGFPMITRMASGIEKKFRVPKKEWDNYEILFGEGKLNRKLQVVEKLGRQSGEI